MDTTIRVLVANRSRCLSGLAPVSGRGGNPRRGRHREVGLHKRRRLVPGTRRNLGCLGQSNFPQKNLRLPYDPGSPDGNRTRSLRLERAAC
jgi:hypothetical protein